MDEPKRSLSIARTDSELKTADPVLRKSLLSLIKEGQVLAKVTIRDGKQVVIYYSADQPENSPN